MPITQISRIRQRSGLKQDLPQLAAGEMAWAIDTRQLYIGNGTFAQGAPSVGNTEILTEFSAQNSATYAMESLDFLWHGPDATTQSITRSLQEKVEDFVSVKDFGARGDGSTDPIAMAEEAAAINKALFELYCSNLYNPATRKILWFPAGLYNIGSDLVKIPPHAILRGEGSASTFIIQNDSALPCAAVLADSAQNYGVNIGSNSAGMPQHIVVFDMTFKNTTANNVLDATGAADVIFNNCRFVGSSTPQTDNGKSCVVLSAPTSNIHFNECVFGDQGTAISISSASGQSVSGIGITNSEFHTLYRGIVANSNINPVTLRAFGCVFDAIYESAIKTNPNVIVISAFNEYKDVANKNNNTPSYPVLKLYGDGSYSIGDIFDRGDAQSILFPRIDSNGSAIVNFNSAKSLQLGTRNLGLAKTLNINSGQIGEVVLNAPDSEKAITLQYSARGTSGTRIGTMRITRFDTKVTYEDSYNESSDIGLTLTPTYKTSSNALVIGYSMSSEVAGSISLTCSSDY